MLWEGAIFKATDLAGVDFERVKKTETNELLIFGICGKQSRTSRHELHELARMLWEGAIFKTTDLACVDFERVKKTETNELLIFGICGKQSRTSRHELHELTRMLWEGAIFKTAYPRMRKNEITNIDPRNLWQKNADNFFTSG